LRASKRIDPAIPAKRSGRYGSPAHRYKRPKGLYIKLDQVVFVMTAKDTSAAERGRTPRLWQDRSCAPRKAPNRSGNRSPADATSGAAVARLYDAKERPSFNPLIAHVADTAAALALARFNPAAERLAAAFWPGPLTLALPKRADRAPRSAGAAAAFGRAASACRRATDRARRSCLPLRAAGVGDARPGVPIPVGNGPPGVCLRLRQRRSRHASCAGCFLCDAL